MAERAYGTDTRSPAGTRRGDREALEGIFALHLDSLWRLALLVTARADLAEDAVQEAFMRAWERRGALPSGDAARARLAGLVFGAASNLTRSERRRRRREARAKPAGESLSPQGAAERREAAAAVSVALAALEEGERVAVALRYREGFSLKEIAETVAIPVSTADVRVKRGLGNLRRRLEAAGFGALALPVVEGTLASAGSAHAPAGLAGRLGALVLAKTKAAAPGAAAKGGLAMKLVTGMVLAGAVAAGVAVMLAGQDAPAQPAEREQAWPPFILSFWCAPTVGETTVERYREIADCGFNVVLPPYPEMDQWARTGKGDYVAANRKILDVCRAVGLKAIVLDPRAYNADPKAPDFAKDLDAVVAEYSGHPALAGYYVKDEPHGKDFPRVAAICKYLRQKNPRHLPYVNLFPNYCDRGRLGGTYAQHVDRFVEQVRPPLVSWDHYALVKKEDCRPEYFDNLEIVRRRCLKARLPYMQIVLSSPHYGYRDPSEAEHRWQVYTTLAYGCHGVMYFTYWPALGPAIIERNGRPGKRYEVIKRLNARVNALAPTLVGLTSAGVYHTEPLPQGAAKLAAEAPVRKMEGGALVLGWLRDAEGGDHVFVVNRSYKDGCKARLILDPAVKKVEEISQETGKPEAVSFDAAAHALTADLAAGEGKLFRLGR